MKIHLYDSVILNVQLRCSYNIDSWMSFISCVSIFDISSFYLNFLVFDSFFWFTFRWFLGRFLFKKFFLQILTKMKTHFLYEWKSKTKIQFQGRLLNSDTKISRLDNICGDDFKRSRRDIRFESDRKNDPIWNAWTLKITCLAIAR